MGGIYLLGRQRGTIVSGNRIHDISCLHYGAWGIYLDEGSSFVTVEGNAVYRTKSSSFHMHYGSNNTVSGNVFFGGASPCIQSTRPETHDRLLFSSNILVSDGAPIYTGDGAVSDGIGSSRNLIVWRSAGEPVMLLPKEGAPETLSDWQRGRGREVGTTVTAELDSDLVRSLGFLPLFESAAELRAAMH
jgi:parallel beta-helix repeat protein